MSLQALSCLGLPTPSHTPSTLIAALVDEVVVMVGSDCVFSHGDVI